jgi:hypothetical protein
LAVVVTVSFEAALTATDAAETDALSATEAVVVVLTTDSATPTPALPLDASAVVVTESVLVADRPKSPVTDRADEPKTLATAVLFTIEVATAASAVLPTDCAVGLAVGFTVELALIDRLPVAVR